MATDVSDTSGKLLAWVLAGTGSLLLYSAYKNRSPLDVLRNTLGSPIAEPVASSSRSSTGSANDSVLPPSGTPGPISDMNAIPRLRMIATRELPPQLVSIPGGGRLDRDAAASLQRINAKIGYTVKNVGAYRSFAEQASLYASDPKRFAPPNKSLHVVGLAIDVHGNMMGKPELIAAFTSEGWHRYSPVGEPWHWSYGVRG